MFAMKSLMMFMLSVSPVASGDDIVASGDDIMARGPLGSRRPLGSMGSESPADNCVTDGGYQWCEATQSCGRPWIDPCPGSNINGPDGLPGPHVRRHPIDPLPIDRLTIDRRTIDPLTIDQPVPQCAEVMCMLYCENGRVMDDSGCPRCLCTDKIDRVHLLGQGLGQGPVPDHVLEGGPPHVKTPSCGIPYDDCGMKTVCPRVVEVTHCGLGGAPGHTTYRLSLVIKDPRVNSLYVMYGSRNNELYIPPAYQVRHLGSNIGGVDSDYVKMNPRLKYDSWLSLGNVDGSSSLIRSVGLDFRKWGPSNPIKTHDGAIFSMDPSKPVVPGKEIVIGQLTLPNNMIDTMIINIEGNFKRASVLDQPKIWAQDNIEFLLKTPSKVKDKDKGVPKDCVSWHDGCNTCGVKKGVLGGCTKMMCFRRDTPHCKAYASGH